MEGLPWRIVSPYDTILKDEACKHCFQPDGCSPRFYSVKSAIEAYRDGGCNSVAVCLECVLEAIEESKDAIRIPASVITGIISTLPDAETREVGESFTFPYNTESGVKKLTFECAMGLYMKKEWVLVLDAIKLEVKQ